MIYAVPPIVFLFYFLLRVRGSREREIVSSATIAAPCEVVFDLVSQVDRMPQWRVSSDWRPSALSPATLSRWGEPVPLRSRIAWRNWKTAEQVQIRSTPGREFAYRHASHKIIRYESIYRLTPGPNGGTCKVTWEVRYRMLRWVDSMRNLWILEDETRESMTASLRAIRETAESVAARPAWQKAAVARHAFSR